MGRADADKYIIKENGVPYLNWKRINADIKKHPERRTEPYYTSLIKHWLSLLPDAFEKPFYLFESKDVLFNTYFEPSVGKERFQIICHIRTKLIEAFGDIVPKDYVGKNLILEFPTQDDYYRYIAHFYPAKKGKRATVYPASAGVTLHEGYMQIALSHQAKTSLSSIVSHELTHVFLAHYHLPVWLNEGLATNAQSMFGSSSYLYYLGQSSSLSPYEQPMAKWTKKDFNDFLSGRMYRRYKFQHLFYETAFEVVHNILVKKVDLPKLLTAIKNKEKVTDALKNITGKELLDFFPPGIKKEIEEDDL